MPIRPSAMVRAGSRTYFITIERTRANKPYVQLTESRYVKTGDKTDRMHIIIFPEYAEKFVAALSDMVARLETTV